MCRKLYHRTGRNPNADRAGAAFSAWPLAHAHDSYSLFTSALLILFPRKCPSPYLTIRAGASRRLSRSRVHFALPWPRVAHLAVMTRGRNLARRMRAIASRSRRHPFDSVRRFEPARDASGRAGASSRCSHRGWTTGRATRATSRGGATRRVRPRGIARSRAHVCKF